ncbi:hypothetical protein D0Z08_19690 [Nocardioides immobilis]|uniref:Uncharacterized protein n=1 Tax=Nocardioides immobilis TaxID=2049295 RepID=A0A417XYK7_9ACTN|nr:hypothetical protein [Nocardioides immobilis]RHW25451.1 hypothetical protein D0Z08_19690 [Nocardioides immobilis]
MIAPVIDLTARIAEAKAPCPCPADRLSRLSVQIRAHLAVTRGELLVPAADTEQTLSDVLAVVLEILDNYPPHQRPGEGVNG